MSLKIKRASNPPPVDPDEISLDYLFEQANKFGVLKTGERLCSDGVDAAIKLKTPCDDYVDIKSSDYPTLKQNIWQCILRAEKYKQMYEKEIN